LELKRIYWYIENKVHYIKDNTFHEDRLTIRSGHGPQNISTLINTAMGFFKANGIGNINRCVANLQLDKSIFSSTVTSGPQYFHPERQVA